MLSAISRECVSRAKWPVSKNWTTVRGLSRLNASAPAGRKNGSFLPQTAKVGGLWVRKYCWNDGYSATLLLFAEQVELRFVGVGTSQIEIVEVLAIRRHQRWVGYAVRVL